ncbi:MAG: PIG-L family deacetylase [Clostridia bacterium]
MSIAKIIIKAVSPIPKFEKCKRFLFVSPHPDDIEVGAGSTVARLCELGKEVYYVIVTNGMLGAKDCKISSEELIEIRKKEVQESAKLLGVKEVLFLGFDDGGNYTQDDVSLELTKIYARIKPDIVFAPDPHLATECHFDHLKTGYAAANACIMSNVALLLEKYGLEATQVKGLAYYYTANPNFYFSTKKCIKKQIQALTIYKSQFEGSLDKKTSELGAIALYLRLRSKKYGLLHGKSNAEAFRVLSPFMFHCCAEKM